MDYPFLDANGRPLTIGTRVHYKSRRYGDITAEVTDLRLSEDWMLKKDPTTGMWKRISTSPRTSMHLGVLSTTKEYKLRRPVPKGSPLYYVYTMKPYKVVAE